MTLDSERIKNRVAVVARAKRHHGNPIIDLAYNGALRSCFTCDQYRLAIEIDMLIIGALRHQNSIPAHGSLNPPPE
jgi:hypothetical protein